jgi:uncharacterized protein with ParB-like and HNH nuclease domain
MPDTLSYEARNKMLSDILFAARRFAVPRYQRPYSWGLDQVSELWEDLLNSDEPYFLGSFIISTESEKEHGYVDIIDGQQRLLTLTLLVAVLRDHAKRVDSEMAKLIQRQDIAIEDRTGSQAFRVLPSDSLLSYFQTHVQTFDGDVLKALPSSSEEQQVFENYKYLFDRVKDELDKFASLEAKADCIRRLRGKVASLVVICVEVSREEDAYEIFETTNARGIDLSVGDLLKNLIFKKIPAKEDRDFAKVVWQEICNDIEATGTEMKKFIRYYWLSKQAFVSEKRLYREIKNKITNWEVFLDDLWKASTLYNTLLEGAENDFAEYKNGQAIYNSIVALRLMGVSQCYVFLLAIFSNYDKLGTDPTRIVQLIEKFSFQYSVVCKLPANKIEKLYSEYARKLQKQLEGQECSPKLAGKVQQVFSDFEKSLLVHAPSAAIFQESFGEMAYKNSEQSRLLIKYILGKVNAHYSRTDEMRIDYARVNIEHLLPRKPSARWKLDRKEIKAFVNKLGNLTILSKVINSRIQNGTIEEKLPEIEKSELQINKKLTPLLRQCNNIWGKPEIERRQREIAEMAYKEIWKLL